MPAVHHFTVFADYFQFVVQDETSEDDFASIWTPEALDIALAVGRSALCPGTLRNVEVPVEVRVGETEPQVDLAAVDHAVEASLEVSSGSIVVMSCTAYLPDAPRFALPAGTYRALSIMSGISSITAEWEPADDKYIVYLWPGSLRHPKLLKHWKGDASQVSRAK
ncbi:MAG: hypothetical protein RLZZ373_2951 [Pseudomonadota bacterium]